MARRGRRCVTGDTIPCNRLKAAVEIAVMGVAGHRQCGGVVVQTRGRVEGSVGGVGVTLLATGTVQINGIIPVRCSRRMTASGGA